MVNLVLIVATLGLYWPWAKIRSMRYMVSSLALGGEPFRFVGRVRPYMLWPASLPASFALLVATRHGEFGHVQLGVLAIMFAVLPWTLWRARRDAAASVSFLNGRCSYHASLLVTYLTVFLFLLLMLEGAYPLLPLVYYFFYRIKLAKLAFGAEPFVVKRGRISWAWLGKALVWIAVCVNLLGMLVWIMTAIYMEGGGDHFWKNVINGIPWEAVVITCSIPTISLVLLIVTVERLSMKRIWLGRHRLHIGGERNQMVFIILSSLAGIICTAGLFLPFAYVRWVRYRIDSSWLGVCGDISDLVDVSQAQSRQGPNLA